MQKSNTQSRFITNNKFIKLGFIIPIVFWGTIIICGFLTENYNHFTNTVSELGRLGTKTQYIFTSGLVLSSVLSIFFVIGLYRTSKEYGIKTIPILMILSFSFSIFAAGVFPLPFSLHGILGSPSMLLPLSPMFAFLFWKTNTIKGIKLTSGLLTLFMTLGFLTLMPNVLENYIGLKQRLFHIGWSLWFVSLSIQFLQLRKSKTN